MANTIRIKRSTGNAAPGTLANAELAFTEGTKILYIGVGTSGANSATIEAVGGLGAFVSLGSTAQTIEGVKTFTGAIVLGTPGSGTLTNCTGLPVSTGVSGLGTGVATFLGTPSSANLASAVTGGTGSGALVFATSPTLVTPTLGAATATSINKVTITAPATGSTITVADGKTLTASNTLTFTGTDASSVAFGTGGTVVYTSGLGAGVATFLGTPSSTNLISAITDETGTGSLVFSASPTFSGTLNCAALTSSGNVTVGGDLVVNGTTTTVNSTVTTLDDPIITLGGDGNGIDDDKDRGVEFKWNDGTAKVGFFGFDESTGYFTFIPQATNSSEVFTGTKGDIQATNFRGALIGNADTVTTNADLTGHIISVGNATVLGNFTAAQLSAALDEKTGTSKPVFDTSPTLITPTIGAATATSINKVTITAPATGSTLTVAEGKTLTASNTLTFTGTDASSVAFGTGGTVVYTSGLGAGVATFLGTPSSANLASAVTGGTGTGALVFATSPTLVTPALGTPSALVGTHISGTGASFTAGTVTTNANLTGAITSSGNTTSLGTASFSSANLAGALTDKTGTGSVVFATSPTLVTPALGTPSALVGTHISGTGASFTAGTATNATNVAITSDNADTSYFVPFLSAATGNLGLKADAGTGASGLTYNPSSVTLTTGNITAGNITTTNLTVINDLLVGAISYADANVVIAPTTEDPAGGTSPSLTVGYLDNAIDFVTVAGGDLYLSTKTNSASTVTSVNIIFEGSANLHETTLGVVDPTADRTVLLPDASDTLVGKATTDTLTNKTWNSTVIAGQYGGTGVANTSKTITLGGNLTTSGAFTTTLTVGANTNVTLPASGTLITDSSTNTLTNKTWNSGVIAGEYGGTGVANTSKTITLGGNLTTSGAFTTTLTATGNTSVTLPTAGTLITDSSTNTLTNKTWNSTVITGEYGGTGVANTSKTITLGGNLTTSGAFTTTLTATANTSVTLPTSGTLLNDAASIDGGSY